MNPADKAQDTVRRALDQYKDGECTRDEAVGQIADAFMVLSNEMQDAEVNPSDIP